MRIAYHIEEAVHEVWILMIGNRRDIWDHDQGAAILRWYISRASSLIGGKLMPLQCFSKSFSAVCLRVAVGQTRVRWSHGWTTTSTPTTRCFLLGEGDLPP